MEALQATCLVGGKPSACTAESARSLEGLQAVERRCVLRRQGDRHNRLESPRYTPLPDACSRRLIEFCCGEDSLLGRKDAKLSRGCHCVRLTQKVDMTSDGGEEFVLPHIGHPNTLLWCSTPCAGGCPWSKINLSKRLDGADRVQKAQRTIRQAMGKV